MPLRKKRVPARSILERLLRLGRKPRYFRPKPKKRPTLSCWRGYISSEWGSNGCFLEQWFDSEGIVVASTSYDQKPKHWD